MEPQQAKEPAEAQSASIHQKGEIQSFVTAEMNYFDAFDISSRSRGSAIGS